MAARPAKRTETETDTDTAAGIARLEGYLLCQAEIGKARTEAEDFAGRLPWLTSAQREEVVRNYALDRLNVSKESLRAVTVRCAELQQEYETRYHLLRRRLLCHCVALLLLSCALCAGCVLVLASR
ncbi:hypothetical protein [Streptomyces sp. GC420]|uniref:hypothetical protein n=1 Tax=Streptomyces sp. GC420 TaxID=2697568 RepID=UPI00141529D6|nr:hypothetical protein [Streptomyces sp. GC420]NBM19640.1 hypothetical protein [Streptomyces sp. GC420]